VALTVDYYFYGYATAGVDYEELSGSVTFEPGNSTATIAVTPIDDVVGENDEPIWLYLTYPWNNEYLIDWQNSSAETTIVDDDGGIATVGISELVLQLDESAGTTPVFAVTRTGGNIGGELTVNYWVYGDATPGIDYEELSGAVTFAAGETEAIINLTPIDDLVGENNESVSVYLSYSQNGNYQINYQNYSAETLIVDDDGGLATVTLSVSAASVDEGGSATFTVTRTGGNMSAPLTVNLYDYSYATPGEDYEPLPESVVIPAGEISFSFDINTIDDALGEYDEEVWLYVDYGDYNLGNPSWAELIIVDNDGGIPVVSIVATDNLASESGDTGTFTISRVGGNTNAPLTVYFWVYGWAENGVDFTFVEEFAVIPAGETSVTITIEPIDDTIAEGDEDVGIYLDWSNDYDVDWNNSEDWVTIEDDD
jgi:hypothetical protein